MLHKQFALFLPLIIYMTAEYSSCPSLQGKGLFLSVIQSFRKFFGLEADSSRDVPPAPAPRVASGLQAEGAA